MAAPAPRLVLLVGHDEPTRIRLSVRARLLGLEPRACLTGARALEVAEAERPLAVIGDLVLPGEDGLTALAAIERRWPGVNTVLLSAIPPGPSPQYRAAHEVDVVLARRGAWEAPVVQAAFPDVRVPDAAAPLWRALDAADEDAVLGLVAGGALPEPVLVLALEHLSATRPAEEVLPVLERALGEDRASAALFEAALELAIGQGRAGVHVAALVAGASDAPDAVRGRAMRWIAERFELEVVLPMLTPIARGGGALGDEACEALLGAGLAAAEKGQDVLRALANGAAVPPRVRARSLEALALALERGPLAALLGPLAQDPDPGMRDLASRLLASADDFELERLFEAAHAAEPEARRAALETIAAQLPRGRARPLLEEAQADPDREVRRLAFELSFARGTEDVADGLARAAASGPAFLQAALLGAMKQGRAGRATVEAIAKSAQAPTALRRKALRLLGLRFTAEAVVPVLREVLEGSDPALEDAARLAAVQLGRTGLALLSSTLSSSASPAVRVGCLETLERHAPGDLVQRALRRASRDPDVEVRAAAVRIAARRAGAEIAPLIESVVRAEQQPLLTDAVRGAASLGKAGYLGLARLALTAAVPVTARRAAWQALVDAFDPEEQAPVRARLEAQAPEVLTAPAPVAPPGAVTELSPSLERAAAHAGWDGAAPPRAAVAPSRPSGPAVESWEVADTAPGRPAEAPVAPPSEDTIRTPPAELPTQPAAPARLPPEAPTLIERPWGEALPRGISTVGRPRPAPPPAPAPVARPAPPPAPPPAPASAPPPARDEGAVTILPSGPAPRKARPRARQVDLRRARDALQTALQLGQNGYRGLRTLADSSRIPTEVRVQALRHLAADFASRPIAQVFERALGSDEPAIQNTALSGVMLQREAALRPLAELVARGDAETATRVRALRFIASRFPKRQTRELFEALLESESATVRKTALESLFSSMRFVPPERVEAGLVNILKEHDDPDVRTSAAKALGAFGTASALPALRSAVGVFKHGPVAAAAKEAVERIQGRG